MWREVAAGLVGCVAGTSLVFTGTTGCRSTAPQRRQLASSNPLDQAAAAVALAEAGDTRATHRLVALLDNNDITVRMYSILALERLYGRTFEYRYYDAPAARALAIRRWQDALRRGELTARAARGTDGASTPDRESTVDQSEGDADE